MQFLHTGVGAAADRGHGRQSLGQVGRTLVLVRGTKHGERRAENGERRTENGERRTGKDCDNVSADLRLKPGPHRALDGCPWIFRGELLHHDPRENGEIVTVVDSTGRFVGRGFYSASSQIAVRILVTRRAEAVDADLMRRRLLSALALRETLYAGRDAVRLVNAEADGLPGLIVDRFGPMLVMEVLSAGLVPFLPVIVETLATRLHPTGILERGDVSVRALEGLPQENRVHYGELVSPVFIHEHGLTLQVDVAAGQKTGHFLDQYENRREAARWAGGREVADIFCHTGAFGLLAAREGATAVVGVDQDERALELAAQNRDANHLGQVRFERANAFDWLRAAERDGRRFDLVILDPPAFTKSRAAVPGALRGYREINLRAFKILRPGGILVTASCSYHVSLDQFIHVVGEAAHDAHRHARVIDVRGQAPDHPVHPLLPESRYLKCLVLTVGD
jgi:23S rRNA (cytosine1962-C5)-methyltransferase